jgi:c-di-GMP-binding flagellar brake protein YcgR
MFTRNVIDFDTVRATDALDSLLELKASIPTAIIQKRTSKRIEIRTKVTASPGNSSERRSVSIEGVTGDISREGCQVIFPQTFSVGDIYWLEFSEKSLVSQSVLARCVRCCFIREDAFETGFRFFDPIMLRHKS